MILSEVEHGLNDWPRSFSALWLGHSLKNKPVSPSPRESGLLSIGLRGASL